MNKKIDKNEIFTAVFVAVFKLDLLKGYMKWNLTDLSRYSKVSRTLIYYYFGKSKESIMNSAVEVLGKEYFGLNDERLNLWRDGNIYESVRRSRALWQASPHVYSFYILRREQNNPVGERLRELERLYEKKLQGFYPGITKAMQDATRATLFGLAVSPSLSEEGLRYSIDLVRKHLNRARR